MKAAQTTIFSHFQPLTLLLLFAAILVVIIVNKLRAAYRQGIREVPGSWIAKFTNLWRVSMVWSGNAHVRYCKLHEQYGSLVRLAPNFVSVSDTSIISTVYGINTKFLKSDFYIVFDTPRDGMNMASMFSTRNPEHHKTLKRPVAQKFAMTSIRSLEPLVDPCSDIFTDAMQASAGQIVDLGTWLQWYAFDVIGAITFNRRFGFMEKQRDIENIIEGLDFGLAYGGIIGQMPWLHPWLLGNLTLRKLRAWLLPNAPDPVRTAINIENQMVLERIEEYDKSQVEYVESQGQDFLAFLRQQAKNTSTNMSSRDLMNHLMHNILAGSDTTAIALRAVLYYIIRNPRVYKTLQEEIDNANLAGKLSKNVTFAESQELPYLQCCLKEAMRFHPSVGYPLERVVPMPGADIGGVYLPGGTIIGVNAMVIHRDKSIFGADANEFRPERWIAADSKLDVPNMERHLLTFGAGARTCIGKNISIMEMGKVIPQLLRQFTITWASEKPEWEVKTWWFARQSGLLVKLERRDNS
ncbi:hypothetical protein H2198_007759 [Neophaeococcomyces mojaviensis]|uniref:Uncharacterized protein n=1 Tax=Neophaeococcomyces mojaviensis TaxID=3383035 RepID=A0ACC2ZZ16_9EURO|nr:hypothetical protein H2198_007759 [Knufia sp. JES_112]